jgi:hypothetical protein
MSTENKSRTFSSPAAIATYCLAVGLASFLGGTSNGRYQASIKRAASGDFDGDGTNDVALVQNSGERRVFLSRRPNTSYRLAGTSYSATFTNNLVDAEEIAELERQAIEDELRKAKLKCEERFAESRYNLKQAQKRAEAALNPTNHPSSTSGEQ